MSIQQTEFSKFLKLLSDNDCLEHVILVGSWSEFLYREVGLLKDFSPNIKTLDVDFLLKNMRKPSPSKDIISLAKDDGYLVEHDRFTNVTKILDKSGLEIEFLLGKAGAGNEVALKTNLGVTAQTLWHMGIISKNVITVDYLGMQVNVPSPEAYTIHKMVINKERGKKMDKDKQAIKNICPYLDPEKFNYIYSTLTKKEKQIVDDFIKDNAISI